HIMVVPLFLLGNIALVTGIIMLSWKVALGGLVAMIVSVVMQGRGHKKEANPPEPFTGPTNAVSRIFLEQWVTFPRFVLSGGWRRALGRE
ncbi:MAG TPA: terminase, partial [Ramlibacter sp.]|nr:terminase [Ramlibacter sp.]